MLHVGESVALWDAYISETNHQIIADGRFFALLLLGELQ